MQLASLNGAEFDRLLNLSTASGKFALYNDIQALLSFSGSEDILRSLMVASEWI